MHLNTVETVSFTDGALSVGEVETEVANTKSAHLCVVLFGEKFSDLREQVGISCWVGTRRFTDGFLVYVDEPLDLGNPADAAIFWLSVIVVYGVLFSLIDDIVGRRKGFVDLAGFDRTTAFKCWL